MKGAGRLCFAIAVAMFGAALVMDKGSAGLAAVLGLAFQALGLFFMTLR